MNPVSIKYEVIAGEGTDPLLMIQRGDRSVPLHSRRNPRREGEILRDKFSEAGEGILIVLGVGLGYHLISLQEGENRFSKVILIDILSGIEEHFYKIEDLKNFREVLNPVFFTGATLRKLEKSLPEHISLDEGGRITVVEHPASMRLFHEYYDEVKALIRRTIDGKAANRITRGAFDRLYLRNSLKNLFYLGALRPVKALFDKGAGRDALVLSSGPSLDITVETLAGSEHLPFIIVVDSALPVLRSYGIEADCIVSIDPQFHIMEHLRFGRGDVPAVVGTLSGYTGLWPWAGSDGCFLTLNSHPLAQLMDQLYPGVVGSIDSHTGTVAGESLMLAIRMGFDRIGVAGLDFSFPRFRIYARGSAYQERFGHFFNNRFSPVETFNGRYIRQASGAVFAEGIPSRRSFLQYRDSLGQLIRNEGSSRILQICGEGLSLPGTESMGIQNFLEEGKKGGRGEVMAC